MGKVRARVALVVVAVLFAVAFAFVGGGCVGDATTYPTLAQNGEGRDVKSGSPITIAADVPVDMADGTVASEVLTGVGTGPAGYALSTAEQARWWAVNQVQRNIFFKLRPDGSIDFNSNTGTDVTISADDLNIDPVTKAVSAKGFNLTTSASAPFGASNQSLDAMREVFKALPEAEKAKILAQLEAQVKIAETVSPLVASGITDVIKLLTAP